MTDLERRGRGLKQLMARQSSRHSLLPTAALLRAKDEMYQDSYEPVVRVLRDPIPEENFK